MSYSCVCLKCKQSYSSDDDADFDGEGFCESCKEANKEIAAKVDEMVANRRASKDKISQPSIYEIARKKPKSTITYFNL